MTVKVTEVTSEEYYILRTGLGRKVFEGDLAACIERATKIRNHPGLQPQLKLIKVITLEEEIRNV